MEEAVVLGELASEYAYWEEQKRLDGEGFFFSTIENIEDNTGLKEKRQKTAIQNLVKEGLVEVKLKGLPAKRHFKISAEKLSTILSIKTNEDGESSSAKKENLDPPKSPSNKNNPSKISNENKEVILSIVEYLNRKAVKSYRATTKNTQSHINARLSEGFTVEDFKTVIDKKCAEWKGTDMEQYLRPETLFGTKFEGYLNAPARVQKKQESDDYGTPMDFYN